MTFALRLIDVRSAAPLFRIVRIAYEPLAMTHRLGKPPLESFGDSTGRVTDL
jgi:hypothetical protein